MKLGRRRFMAALGLSGLGLGSAHAGSAPPAAPPLRFVGVYMPHGRAHELWQPRADFDIEYEGAILAPLAPFKDKLLVIDGVDLPAIIRG